VDQPNVIVTAKTIFELKGRQYVKTVAKKMGEKYARPIGHVLRARLQAPGQGQPPGRRPRTPVPKRVVCVTSAGDRHGVRVD